MKGRFPWIRTEANFKRYLDLAPVSGKVWPSWSMFQAGWISQDGWNSASEVFHGLWANHRLLSHFKPTDCSESQGGAKVWVPESQILPHVPELWWNGSFRPSRRTWHFCVYTRPEPWHWWADKRWCLSCSLLRGFSPVAEGGHPARLGWAAVHRPCGEALGKPGRTTARPSTADLDLFPGNAPRLCWEGLPSPCQGTALLGWCAAQDVNAPSALCAGLHSPWVMIPGKKDKLFWGC